jgi:hypothetical protein
LDFGISLTIHDAYFSPLVDNINSDNIHAYRMFCGVDLISSSVSFKNPASPWLTGVRDFNGTTPANWVRGGPLKNKDWKLSEQKYSDLRSEDYYYKLGSNMPITDYIRNSDGKYTDVLLDEKGRFSQIGGGWWAPYALASIFDNGPAYGYENRESEYDMEAKFHSTPAVHPKYGANGLITPKIMGSYSSFMTELYSVDIVLTSNKDLWTRCPVIEISDDPATSVNNAKRHELRKSRSVNKEGYPDGTSTTGMGWFPGYAICVETGERLNMMFGENSSLPGQNGADMIFNPTTALADASGYVFGGGHYIYVFGHQDLYYKPSSGITTPVDPLFVGPAYDEGAWALRMFQRIESGASPIINKTQLYKNVMWTAIPLASPVYTNWLEPGNDATISIRVSRPYKRWASTTNASVSNPKNGNMPLYRFSTKELETLKNQRHIAEKYVDSIYITPNPYYGMAQGYETSQLDTRVKFINLPNVCDIKIYTLEGTLIRTLKKPDDGTTYYEWDLKNSANIPIASGMYLIHIRSKESKAGVNYNFEKTLKFLCIQRPVDVNAF